MIGTNHFIDYLAACSYYRAYGFSGADVRAKLDRGEIALGRPSCGPGEVATVIRGEGRYQVGERPRFGRDWVRVPNPGPLIQA